jgi:protein ImuA
MSTVPHISRSADPQARPTDKHARRLDALRVKLAQLERHDGAPPPSHLPLTPEIHAHMPPPGLSAGMLHELAGEAHGDRPAAFGFALALMATAQRSFPGPTFLVATRRALSQFGQPYGHGLDWMGLDPARLMLVETRSEKDALWALEEVLRSNARPSVVAGAIDGPIGLISSRRLNLPAARFGTPLLVLASPGRTGASAAATRWRIASALAARDRFRTLVRCRWRVTLERCRNGRPGEWLIEWDHVAHRFRVVEGVADRAPAAGPVLRRAG